MGDRERSDLREAPPLVVDLDGTLITRDLLRECLSRLGRERPWWVPLLPVYLVRGRAAFKAKVAHLVVIAPARLPYRRQVLEFLRAEHARGRRLILATAAQRRSAEAVARHLGLFEAVIAGDHTHTPKGVEKLAAIRAVVGGVFDYMGDARTDLPIFQAARLAILVHPSTRLLTRARASCRVGHVFD
jgi:phosphoglycolate phosphatase-like HAD superfamily hydrolase